MKLFKSLLVAPAALGLLAPMSAMANEINLNDVSGYSSSKDGINISDFNSAKELNTLIAGGEGMVNDHDSDSFSATTTMSGTAEFLIGAKSNGDSDAQEAVMTNYHYSFDLNTSFTGDDKLNIEISTGNQFDSETVAENTLANALDFGEPSGDALKIEDINYTFPLGEWKLSFGESMDASKNWPNACAVNNIYDDLGDCGAANSVDLSGDISFSAGRSFGDGWDVGVGISSNDGETTSGMFTKEGADYYGAAIGYSADNYAVTVAYSDKDTTSYWGTTASYSFDGGATISGGVEFGNPESSSDDTTQYVVGVSSDVGEGTLSAALGTKAAYTDSDTEHYAYDVSYSYPVNDSMTVTPFFFIVENAGEDDNGFGVITSFKF